MARASRSAFAATSSLPSPAPPTAPKGPSAGAEEEGGLRFIAPLEREMVPPRDGAAAQPSSDSSASSRPGDMGSVWGARVRGRPARRGVDTKMVLWRGDRPATWGARACCKESSRVCGAQGRGLAFRAEECERSKGERASDSASNRPAAWGAKASCQGCVGSKDDGEWYAMRRRGCTPAQGSRACWCATRQKGIAEA